MPVKVPNPRKNFQFNIFLPGLDPFLAQDVKEPDEEFDVVEHGDTGFQVKTAGQRKISMLTVSRIRPQGALDNFIAIWFNRIRNFVTGGGEVPSSYKYPIIVEQYANDGITVIERKQYIGCWPQKINGTDFSRKGSDNTTESIEFCVDEILPF